MSYQLKNAHFAHLPPFNPKFENVPLALDHCTCAEILHIVFSVRPTA